MGSDPTPGQVLRRISLEEQKPVLRPLRRSRSVPIPPSRWLHNITRGRTRQAGEAPRRHTVPLRQGLRVSLGAPSVSVAETTAAAVPHGSFGGQDRNHAAGTISLDHRAGHTLQGDALVQPDRPGMDAGLEDQDIALGRCRNCVLSHALPEQHARSLRAAVTGTGAKAAEGSQRRWC